MADFATFIENERARLTKEHDDLTAQRAELDTKLAAIARELGAIEAYEAAKAGRAPARNTRTPRVAAATTSTGATKVPRGSKRDELIALIKQHPNVTRGDILSSLGIKGNKAQESSISNTLANLKKAGTITADGGKYTVAA